MQYTGVEMGGYRAKQPVLIVGNSVLYEEFAGKVGKACAQILFFYDPEHPILVSTITPTSIPPS